MYLKPSDDDPEEGRETGGLGETIEGPSPVGPDPRATSLSDQPPASSSFMSCT